MEVSLWHSTDHEGLFFDPEQCLTMAGPQEIQDRELGILIQAGKVDLARAVIRAHTATGALATSDVARSSLVDLEGSGSQMSSFLENQKSESIRKAVYRAKNVAPTDTIDGIDSALTPMIQRPPKIDPFAVWIFAKHVGGPVEEHYYAWTTNRMLESVHWWMQTNGKVRDGVGRGLPLF